MTIQSENSTEDTAIDSTQKKTRKSAIFGAIFLVVMTVAVLMFIFNLNDFNETMGALTSVTGLDMMLAIGCLVVYIAMNPLSLCVLCKVSHIKTSFTQNYLIGAIEHFFNGITPYQTGAQPFQVLSFSRRGVKASEGTGVIITNYLAQLVAQNFIMLVTLIYAKDFFGMFAEKSTIWIPIIGFFMNVLTLVAFFCIVTCKWVRTGLKKALRWLCHFHFIGKHFSKSIPTFDEYCDNAQIGAKEALAHPLAFFSAVGLRLISLLFYYAIPFFILRGLNVNVGYEFLFFTMMATCFAMNAVVWIPTPGTSGGIEFSFTVLFTIFAGFSGAIAAAAAILWRALTYYILLLVSFLEYLILEILFRKKVDH